MDKRAVILAASSQSKEDLKLIVIEHLYSNGEYMDQTYILAPREWSEEELEKRLEKAKNDFLEALRNSENTLLSKPSPRIHPDYSKYPDKTVREIDIIHKKEKEEYEAWSKKNKLAQKQFSYFLSEQGFSYLHEIEDSYSLHWHSGRLSNYLQSEVFDDNLDTFFTPEALRDSFNDFIQSKKKENETKKKKK